MSDAVSQHGFTVARRGYAPEQVDATLRALTADRDEAWERLSVLGSGLREMEKRLGEIVQAREDAPEPDYGRLSEQAATLMAIADNEAEAVRSKALRAAGTIREDAQKTGQSAARAAEAHAATARGEAEQAVRETEATTRAEAERIRIEAEYDANTTRDAATADAARVRLSAAEAEERAEAKLAELRRRSDEMFAQAQADADAQEEETLAGANRRLREAEQHREAVLAEIRTIEGDAQTKAEGLLSAARVKAERLRVAGETDQRDFAVRHQEMQEQLDSIKKTLAELTGAAVGAIEPGRRPAALEAAPREADAPDLTLDLFLKPEPVADAAPAAPAAPPVPATPAAPPAPPAPPAAPPAAGAPAEPTAQDEPKIVPKIVIVDDGIDHDTRRSNVTRRG
ncbi:hypothetical protein [Kitasatospora sp. NBC_01539]|uniref:hypothetical protein n=1 Tax=Kitasatospora sp. NBC_01539 TaxID=2903577 RepID=UPI0038600F28